MPTSKLVGWVGFINPASRGLWGKGAGLVELPQPKALCFGRGGWRRYRLRGAHVMGIASLNPSYGPLTPILPILKNVL